jgi:translation initiation factor 4E
MGFLGNQFHLEDEIFGVVLSIRVNEDILSVWNRTANDQVLIIKIRSGL